MCRRGARLKHSRRMSKNTSSGIGSELSLCDRCLQEKEPNQFSIAALSPVRIADSSSTNAVSFSSARTMTPFRWSQAKLAMWPRRTRATWKNGEFSFRHCYDKAPLLFRAGRRRARKFWRPSPLAKTCCFYAELQTIPRRVVALLKIPVRVIVETPN